MPNASTKRSRLSLSDHDDTPLAVRRAAALSPLPGKTAAPGHPPPAVDAAAGNLADLLPSRPLLSSPRDGWGGPTLDLFEHPPAEVDVPGRDEHVIVLNLANKIFLEDRSEGRPLRRWADAGHISVIPAGLPLMRRWVGRPKVLLAQLSAATLGAAAADLGLDAARVSVLSRVAVPDPQMHRIGQLLLAEIAEPSVGIAAMSETLSQALAIHLLRHHSSLADKLVDDAPDFPAGRFARVVDFMKAHLEEQITLAQMSGVVGLSQTQFARAFRQAAGRAPHAYLIDLRVQEAQRLLEETRQPVTAIALSCGFEQPGHFATTFRRKTGFTPRSWRLLRAG